MAVEGASAAVSSWPSFGAIGAGSRRENRMAESDSKQSRRPMIDHKAIRYLHRRQGTDRMGIVAAVVVDERAASQQIVVVVVVMTLNGDRLRNPLASKNEVIGRFSFDGEMNAV